MIHATEMLAYIYVCVCVRGRASGIWLRQSARACIINRHRGDDNPHMRNAMCTSVRVFPAPPRADNMKYSNVIRFTARGVARRVRAHNTRTHIESKAEEEVDAERGD